jgi:hypothetical protein
MASTVAHDLPARRQCGVLAWMTNVEALGGMVVCVSLTLGITRRAVGRLGDRAAEIWHVPVYRQSDPLPSYLRPERPPGTPDVVPVNPHFQFLDRRPQREILLPAHLAPRAPSEISAAAIGVWLLAGCVLIGFAVSAWLLGGPRSAGTVDGVAGFALLILVLKGWLQNRRLS